MAISIFQSHMIKYSVLTLVKFSIPMWPDMLDPVPCNSNDVSIMNVN